MNNKVTNFELHKILLFYLDGSLLFVYLASLIFIGPPGSFHDSIFTLAYGLDDAIFTAADRFGHLLAFFLPGVTPHLGAMAGFREAPGSLVF